MQKRAEKVNSKTSSNSSNKSILYVLIGIVILVTIYLLFAKSNQLQKSPYPIGNYIREFKTFPVNAEDQGRTGDSFCLTKGYSKCTTTLKEVFTNYYDSNDGSCARIQYWITESELASCSEVLQSSEVFCRPLSGGTPPIVEPAYGDAKWWTFYKEVVCAR